MYLHEYQAKLLLSQHGVKVAPFRVISSLNEVEEAIKEGIQEGVLKIQVHAGGRGKAGGVKIAKSAADLRQMAKELLGMHMVNNQTGPEGVVAEKVLLDSLVSFQKEYYVAVILDRKNACASVIASAEGGMDIEEIAHHHPDKIIIENVPDSKALRLYQLSRLAKALGLRPECKEAFFALINNLVKAFFALDATLVEINPLVASGSEFIALDAKISLDESALFRHKELAAMYDPSQSTLSERKAHEHDLAYVALEGTIGCVVNGAGLAMATMDLIRYWGGKPANFLDIGGGASEEKVVEGFTILFHDPAVQVILVNIFGGIMNCEIIAQALISASIKHPHTASVIVRMEGTNVQSAKKMLKESNLAVITADSLDEAAKIACEKAFACEKAKGK